MRLVVAGSTAFERLGAAGAGRVAAVFDRSFYIEIGGKWICIGTEALPMGPLNVRSSAPAATNWPARGLLPGERAEVSPRAVRVGACSMFSMAGLAAWQPPPPPPAWSPGPLRYALQRLDRAAGDRIPDDGLGIFILAAADTTRTSSVAAAARDTIAQLAAGVRSAVSAGRPLDTALAAPVSRLLGLGPGLTPSGDDFLGGMMVALHLAGHAPLAADLARLVLEPAGRLTTRLSGAHLAAAAAGAGHEALHVVLNDLLAGDVGRPGDALAAIDRIGHTSGWDALAGAVTVFRALLVPRGVLPENSPETSPGHRTPADGG